MQKKITIGEKYDPAMKITDPKEADEYFEKCVRHTMSFGVSRQEAEQTEKQNLGYYAGYYDHETRLRVEKLFKCSHPILGSASNGEPSFDEAFNAGKQFAEKSTKETK